jgi:hypothetical protein
MRAKSEMKMVVLEQTQFKSTMECKSSHSLGFRPFVSKEAEKLIWRKNPNFFKGN